MRYSTHGFACAVLALVLTACGGGGGGGSNPPPLGGGNTPPVANAGPNQTVTAGATVTLNGSLSSDANGTIASYAWTQTAGTAVTLSNAAIAQPTFPAPAVVAATTFTFSLIVTDNGGATSAASTVTITVNPVVAGNVNVSGTVTFARVPFSTTGRQGLNYGAPVQRPARAVSVRALAAGTATELASTTSGNDGSYTLSVPANTNVTVQVQAIMSRQSPLALPRWNVRVQDGAVVGGAAYAYSDNISFNSSTGGSRDIAIPTGINGTGSANGPRSSGPFAILDSIYQSMQMVLTAAPTTNFPTLIVDWGTQTSGTFFSGANPQHIALLSDLGQDTDEFDQHVVAHEFGHYLEHNFSRADNIGGSHGLGDRLDPRVSFGEGWGYAFAAIALNDTNARDSFFGDVTPNDGIDNPVQASSGFNIQQNPTSPTPNPGDDIGCWCSESSVWSLLYDLYDNDSEANDNVALGFTPIWNVLVGAQAETPAFTTIFSFVAALKSSGTGQNASIDTLVNAQNITATGIEPFAMTETHEPVVNKVLLPVYAIITRGQTVVLSSADDAGNYNKAGNHRFLRFNPGGNTSPITVSVATSNTNTAPDAADPDFVIYRDGVAVFSAENPPNGLPETGTFTNVVANSTYVLDVYDCANGCAGEQGIAGDYTLTVTIN